MANFKSFKAVTKLSVSTVPCTLARVQGYYQAAADAWLQIHDSVGEPDAGAVPILSFALSYASPYSWGFDPGLLVLSKGLFIAVSSAEESYDSVTFNASTTWLDLEGDYGLISSMPTDFSTVGSLETGDETDTQTATVTEALYQVDYINKDGAARWLMLFKGDGVSVTPSDGDKPLAQWGGTAGVANSGTLSLKFGTGGLRRDDFVSVGFYLVQSSTKGTLTATTSVASLIRAYYK